MHLFALDDKDQIINVADAAKQNDYYCLECRSLVRRRGGFLKQIHFYHIDPNRECRQSGKSLIHLQVQHYFQKILPDCVLEKRFPSINRIADVCVEKSKLIFEVQCSSIEAREIEERNRDYQSLGYQVIWILHDSLYNKGRMTSAEYFLQEVPHYFTDIDEDGRGKIYDQWDLITRGYRLITLEVREVLLSNPRFSVKFHSTTYPHWLRKRMYYWPICFSGDYLDYLSALSEIDCIDFVEAMQTKENTLMKESEQEERTFYDKMMDPIRYMMNIPYRANLKMLLEQMTK